MAVIALYSFKGGVGKTTAAVNLAFEASRAAKRILLVDLDPQGAACACLRVEPNIAGGAKRLLAVIDAALADQEWLVGEFSVQRFLGRPVRFLPISALALFRILADDR